VAQLRSSEARFRQMVEVSPIGMAVGSLDGQLALVNDAYLHLLGYTRAEYEAGAIDWQALTPEEYRVQDTRAFEAAFTQGVSTTYEKEMLTKTGERLPLELTLIRYNPQQVVGYLKDLRVEKAQAQLMADQAATLKAQQEASQAFMAFTEAASHFDDLDQLAQLALDTLHMILPGSSAVFYDRAATSWQPRVWTGDLKPELLAVLQQGVPLETPIFAELLHSGAPVFVDGWTEAAQGVAHTEQFQTVAAYPVTQREQIRAVLSVALQDQPRWSEAQRATVRSVGRSFTLLYERIAVTQEVGQQRKEVEQRALALEAFEQLSKELVHETDRYALIQRALEIMRSMLMPGFLIHFALDAGLWRIKAQAGDMGDAALQRLASAGWPFEVPTLYLPWTTGQDFYQDQYAQGSDSPAEVVEQVNTTATLVVRMQGQPIGLILIALFDQRPLTSVDRTVLNTARQSLELALERAQSVEVLAERTAQLEAANEELEAFTYSASHDLRTPVRHVMGFAELAEKALEKAPNERAQHHLQVVKQAALRMTNLIDSMLLLSRSGRQELHEQLVDLNRLVAQARWDVAAEFGSHPVHWQVGELPMVQGDPQLLQQVVTNLLSNAVKYSARREVSEVEVKCKEQEGEWCLSVTDNGAGFDSKYAQKLFGLFQRLHTEKDFQGTGVGLATVKRIVRRHGGRVFAESDGRTGATFGFTLPKLG